MFAPHFMRRFPPTRDENGHKNVGNNYFYHEWSMPLQLQSHQLPESQVQLNPTASELQPSKRIWNCTSTSRIPPSRSPRLNPFKYNISSQPFTLTDSKRRTSKLPKSTQKTRNDPLFSEIQHLPLPNFSRDTPSLSRYLNTPTHVCRVPTNPWHPYFLYPSIRVSKYSRIPIWEAHVPPLNVRPQEKNIYQKIKKAFEFDEVSIVNALYDERIESRDVVEGGKYLFQLSKSIPSSSSSFSGDNNLKIGRKGTDIDDHTDEEGDDDSIVNVSLPDCMSDDDDDDEDGSIKDYGPVIVTKVNPSRIINATPPVSVSASPDGNCTTSLTPSSQTSMKPFTLNSSEPLIQNELPFSSSSFSPSPSPYSSLIIIESKHNNMTSKDKEVKSKVTKKRAKKNIGIEEGNETKRESPSKPKRRKKNVIKESTQIQPAPESQSQPLLHLQPQLQSQPLIPSPNFNYYLQPQTVASQEMKPKDE